MRILVPTDFGPASALALRYGRALARALGAELHVLYAVSTIVPVGDITPGVGADLSTATVTLDLEADARTRLHAFADSTDADGDAPIEAVTTTLSPADAIVSYATDEHMDLVVMGTHGRTGVEKLLLGSVAERVIRASPCPVLAVRHGAHEVQLDAATEGLRSRARQTNRAPARKRTA